MPNMTRQPEAVDSTTMHVVAVPRQGGSSVGTIDTPSRDLLPAVGSLGPAPVPAPARALALDALRLLRRLRDPARRPARWSEPTFTREIELIRTHLAPLRSRKVLAASYGREAFHLMLDDAARDDPCPVRLAYALRWLELGGGPARPTWPAILDQGLA